MHVAHKRNIRIIIIVMVCLKIVTAEPEMTLCGLLRSRTRLMCLQKMVGRVGGSNYGWEIRIVVYWRVFSYVCFINLIYFIFKMLTFFLVVCLSDLMFFLLIHNLFCVFHKLAWLNEKCLNYRSDALSIFSTIKLSSMSNYLLVRIVEFSFKKTSKETRLKKFACKSTLFWK